MSEEESMMLEILLGSAGEVASIATSPQRGSSVQEYDLHQDNFPQDGLSYVIAIV